MQAGSTSEEPGREDAAVVDDQKIVGAEQVRQGLELKIFECPCLARKMQHARSAAVRQRLLGNQVIVQGEVEVRNQHSIHYKEHGLESTLLMAQETFLLQRATSRNHKSSRVFMTTNAQSAEGGVS